MLQNFSKNEKIMIFILFILLIGLIYYRFIYITVNNATQAANNQAQAIQSELDAANIRLSKIKSLDSMDTSVQRMGSYNSIKGETAFLNTVLAGVSDYTVTFADVTRDGNLVRRGFQLRFTASSYADAVKIINDLTNGDFRCLIGDVRCSIGDGGQTTMDVSGTFYETMVGGAPDSALPADTSDSAEVSDLMN